MLRSISVASKVVLVWYGSRCLTLSQKGAVEELVEELAEELVAVDLDGEAAGERLEERQEVAGFQEEEEEIVAEDEAAAGFQVVDLVVVVVVDFPEGVAEDEVLIKLHVPPQIARQVRRCLKKRNDRSILT